jgi:hypothetical protein
MRFAGALCFRGGIGCALAVTTLGIASCDTVSAPPADSVPAQTSTVPSAIEAHIRFLASDVLEGREAGTRGFDVAAEYVAAEFRKLELEPKGDAQSYFQAVEFQAQWLEKGGTHMTLRSGNGTQSLTLGRDVAVASSPLSTSSQISAPAVFVGYGIEAPAFGLNDYEGLDVRGKVVVTLAGYPTFLPSEEGAHYGSGREKLRTAVAKGAVAAVTVYTQQYETVLPWEYMVTTLDMMQMTWLRKEDGVPFVVPPELDLTALMNPNAGERLFEGAPRSYSAVRAEAFDGAPKGFPLAVEIEIAQQSRHERRTSANVAAVLPGTDPLLRDEYVVVIAHLDHDGIGTEVDGDRIYNGAMDNAAGIATMLEAARELAADPPRRSVLFLAVTAEEKGLLGSEYFASYPTVPIENIVAAVNLDMPVLLYDFTDVIAFGANHSSLQRVLETAVAKVGLTLTPDPIPEQAIFTRSDHYSFVQRGVPAIFLMTGWNTPAGAGEGGKVFTDFLTAHYHKPSDDLNRPFDYAAGAKFAHVNAMIAREIANADARPQWKEGDFFGELFGGAAR